jgi:glucokinase
MKGPSIMKNCYLGIDLGGTGVKIAIVNKNGDILEQTSFPSACPADPKMIAAAIISHSMKLKHFPEVKSIGVGVAGDIDQQKGIVRFSPNLGWRNVHFRDMLARKLRKHITIDNDANAAAFGAFWLDSKGKAKNLICVTLGTGVGGGVVINGELYRGATGSAGEIGHITIDPNGPRCNCGNYGCIERYVGAPYLSSYGRQAVKRGNNGKLAKLAKGNLNSITPAMIAEAANKGDSKAKEIFRLAGERLGILFADLINLLNPEMIVLSGGVSQSADLMMKSIKDTITMRAYETPAKACKIIVSRYTHKLGVVGAALLAK